MSYFEEDLSIDDNYEISFFTVSKDTTNLPFNIQLSDDGYFYDPKNPRIKVQTNDNDKIEYKKLVEVTINESKIYGELSEDFQKIILKYIEIKKDLLIRIWNSEDFKWEELKILDK